MRVGVTVWLAGNGAPPRSGRSSSAWCRSRGPALVARGAQGRAVGGGDSAPATDRQAVGALGGFGACTGRRRHGWRCRRGRRRVTGPLAGGTVAGLLLAAGRTRRGGRGAGAGSPRGLAGPRAARAVLRGALADAARRGDGDLRAGNGGRPRVRRGGTGRAARPWPGRRGLLGLASVLVCRTPCSGRRRTCSDPASASAPGRRCRCRPASAGTVPAFPLLAALPSPGDPPSWAARCWCCRSSRGRPGRAAVRGCRPESGGPPPATVPARGAGRRRAGGLLPCPVAPWDPARWRRPAPCRPPRWSRSCRWRLGGLVGALATRCSALRAAAARRLPGWAACPAAGSAAEGSLGSGACPKPTARCGSAGPARLVVLVSGTGTNLQALLDACGEPAYGAGRGRRRRRPAGTEGVARAERGRRRPPSAAGRRLRRPRRRGTPRSTERVAAYAPDLVGLAGFLKLVGPAFLGPLRRRVPQHAQRAAAVVPGHARPARRAGATA